MTHPLAPSRTDFLKGQSYVAGRWIDADRTLTVIDPATGEAMAEVADADPAMAIAAVDAAAAAFETWSRTTARERSDILRRWFDLVRAHTDDLARLMSWEQGKPVAEAKGEIAYAAGYLEWFSEEAKRAYGEIIPAPLPGRQLMVVKEPVGVAGIVTPWNFPAAMIARKFAPALAAGCTVVAKPAGETPLSALALVRLAEEAGVPPGVINILTSSRPADISAAWMADSRVRKLSFTGSTGVGKLLARQGADTLKRLSLELGGDAPFIVFEDADLDVALDGLRKAKFRNAGQACIAANRIYIHEAVYPAFLDRVVRMVEGMTIGAAADGAFDIGPLINPAAVAKMESFVADAVAKGARLLAGGARRPGAGYFFAPTVLADVSPDTRIACEEVFGPLAALASFKTEAEVLDRANASPYGLAAYLFSTDLARVHRVASRLQTGIVGVNEGAVSTEVAPFGGVKEPGYGREGSRHGMADYQNMKYICLGGV